MNLKFWEKKPETWQDELVHNDAILFKAGYDIESPERQQIRKIWKEHEELVAHKRE